MYDITAELLPNLQSRVFEVIKPITLESSLVLNVMTVVIGELPASMFPSDDLAEFPWKLHPD